MNARIILENLRTGIGSAPIGHIQGFPDHACAPLRGIYALVWEPIHTIHTDPAYKAGAVLTILTAASGLLLLRDDGWRSDADIPVGRDIADPLCDALECMSTQLCSDADYVEKAAMCFAAADPAAIDDLCRRVLAALVHVRDSEQLEHLRYLETLLTLLSEPRAAGGLVQTPPAPWDHVAWGTAFRPIWDSRDRSLQHKFRARYYQSHVALVEAGRYLAPSGRTVEIPWDAYTMMQQSKLYSAELTTPLPETVFDTTVEVWQMDCLDAAKRIQDETPGVTAVLNLANRQNPGGGVYTGSGAQEESCFLRSNYYTALYPFAQYAEQYDLPRAEAQYPLDRNFGGVWSAGVTVFRGHELDGYPLLEEPWQTNFIAVAAINRPATVMEHGELMLHPSMVAGMRNKIRTIMGIAADNGVSNLVLGTLGCGAFKNPPKHVAALFREVLEEPAFKGRYRRIVFAIYSGELCDVFAETFGVKTER